MKGNAASEIVRTFIVNVVAIFIIDKQQRHEFRAKFKTKPIDFDRLERFYARRSRRLKDKIKSGEKVKVAFTVVYDSVFPAEIIYQKMLHDGLFDPVLIVVPDVVRGRENMLLQMRKTYKHLSAKYEKVEIAYNFNKDRFVDYSNRIDLVFFANPYDPMTNRTSGIKYLSGKGVLPLYVSYGMMPDYYAIRHIIDLPSLNLAWRVFADTEENLKDFRAFTKNKGRNVVLSGYAKLDWLAQVEVRPRARKMIIIAPHHTVSNSNLPLSNFLRYADFFLNLPKRYPGVDFVFRPHPLLFITLANDNLWGKERVERYLAAMRENPNVEYQNGGDYFDTFVNSDGIIHDCSSFLVEYLFTEHPPCYLLRDNKEVETVFAGLGKNTLRHYYQAFDEEGVIRYIERVVLQGDDPMRTERVDYVNQHLKGNYPHTSDFIINHIKEALS